jgi:hypothetical protein
MREEVKDGSEEWPSEEDSSQAAFYFFMMDFKHYIRNKTYAPLICTELDEKEKELTMSLLSKKK